MSDEMGFFTKLNELIASWRADIPQKNWGDEMHKWQLIGEDLAFNRCADELADLLAAQQQAAPSEESGK
jgi:hypothetical protein